MLKHLLVPCFRGFLKRCRSRFQATPHETLRQKEMAEGDRVCRSGRCHLAQSPCRISAFSAPAVLSNLGNIAEG